MIINISINLEDFKAWNEAKHTLTVLKDLEFNRHISALTTIEDLLANENPNGISGQDLNDFLSFEQDTIANWLNFEWWGDLYEFAYDI